MIRINNVKQPRNWVANLDAGMEVSRRLAGQLLICGSSMLLEMALLFLLLHFRDAFHAISGRTLSRVTPQHLGPKPSRNVCNSNSWQHLDRFLPGMVVPAAELGRSRGRARVGPGWFPSGPANQRLPAARPGVTWSGDRHRGSGTQIRCRLCGCPPIGRGGCVGHRLRRNRRNSNLNPGPGLGVGLWTNC